MAFVLIVNDVVVQKQPYEQEGFTEAPESVICGYFFINGVFLPPAQSPLDWPSLISTRRYKSETSGTTVNTLPIATDRDSQSLITGAAVAALLDSDYSLNWKTSAGFIALSAVQILNLASAVRAHVQASFDREAQLLAAVADGSITAGMLEEGWPG